MDVSYVDIISVGSVTVLDYESLELLENQAITCEEKMPYRPNAIVVYENLACHAVMKKLKIQPDVFLIDV